MNHTKTFALRIVSGLLLSFALINGSVASTIHYGNDSVFSTSGSFGANYLLGEVITVTDQFNLTSAGSIFRATSGTFKAGIYSNISGSPGTLLAQTDVYTITAAGNVEIPVLSSVTLDPGDYWFMGIYSSNTNNWYSTTGGTVKYKSLSFSSDLPSDFGTALSYSGQDFNYYLGGTVAAIPEPETYAMLLAGLGLLGWHARRRKKKEAV